MHFRLDNRKASNIRWPYVGYQYAADGTGVPEEAHRQICQNARWLQNNVAVDLRLNVAQSKDTAVDATNSFGLLANMTVWHDAASVQE